MEEKKAMTSTSYEYYKLRALNSGKINMTSNGIKILVKLIKN